MHGSDQHSQDSDKGVVPPAPAEPKDRTLRIEGIPANTSREDLEKNLRLNDEKAPSDLTNALRTAKVRSLAKKDKRFRTATVDMTTASVEKLVQLFNSSSSFNTLGYRLDSSFGGITPLAEDSDGAECDIIAVPGLNSHAIGSWKAPGKSDVWLRDWLPEDVPKTRILLYGYDTSLVNSTSVASIHDLSKSFLESLATFRSGTNTETRPIVFIGHSLGGLLIKEALVQSRNTIVTKTHHKARRHVSEYSHGMAFFGVPHWGIQQEHLLSMVCGQPVEDLIRTLAVTGHGQASPYLRALSTSFAERFAGETRVFSFFETKTSPIQVKDGDGLKNGKERRLLVNEQSATNIGLTGKILEETIPVDLDHSGLVKFPWVGDERYTSTKDRISGLVSDALAAKSRARDTLLLESSKSEKDAWAANITQGSPVIRGVNIEGTGHNFSLGNNVNWGS